MKKMMIILVFALLVQSAHAELVIEEGASAKHKKKKSPAPVASVLPSKAKHAQPVVVQPPNLVPVASVGAVTPMQPSKIVSQDILHSKPVPPKPVVQVSVPKLTDEQVIVSDCKIYRHTKDKVFFQCKKANPGQIEEEKKK